MDFGDSLERKQRPSLLKSDTFESWTSSDPKSRFRTGARIFGLLTLFGVIVIIAGSVIIVIVHLQNKERNSTVSDTITKLPGSKYRRPDGERNSNRQEELTVAAFVLLGAGGIILLIGAPSTMIFIAKYHMTNDERSPILSNNDMKLNYKNQPDSSTREGRKKRRARKKMPSWKKNTTRTLSREGFRFAAHRHPSLNHISIDGSQFFFRRLSEHSTSSSDADLSNSRNTSEGNWLNLLMRRIFGRSQSNSNEARPSNVDNPSTHIEDFKFLSAQTSEEANEPRRTLRSNQDPFNNIDGLYKLGEE